MDDPRRRVPRTDVLLADPRLAAAERLLGRTLVKSVVAQAQQQARAGEIDPEQVAEHAVAALASQRREPAACHQRHRRRRAHESRPRATVQSRHRRGRDRERGHRCRVRPEDRSPCPAGSRRAGRPRPGGPDRGRGTRGQQQRRGAAVDRHGPGARKGNRGQPGRADRNRRWLPAARADGVNRCPHPRGRHNQPDPPARLRRRARARHRLHAQGPPVELPRHRVYVCGSRRRIGRSSTPRSWSTSAPGC